MEIYNNNIKVISGSVDEAVSGSILRIHCLADGSLIDVKFGKSFPNKAFTASSDTVASITMTAGQFIDGPIGEAKNGSGGFLFYLRT